MTYGRDPGRCKWLTMNGAGVSHSANRVRGDLVLKAPSSAPSGHLLPSRWKRAFGTTGRRASARIPSGESMFPAQSRHP
jgi:hypothetical protein